MMKTIRATLAGFARSPLKLTLTLLTVGIGVGALIFAMSISTAFSRYLAAQLDQDGVVVMVSNATLSASTGQVEPVRPSQLDENALSVLKTDIPGVAAVAPVDTRGFNELAAGSTVYRIRSVVESDDSYATLMGLTMTAGSFYTAEDVSSGGKKAVISQGLAEILFGSAQAAIGQTLRPPAAASGTTSSSTTATTATASTASAGAASVQPRPPVMPTFTVVGVFADVGELKRTAYGVGDMIVPYTASLPQGMNIQMARRFAMSTIAIRVRGAGVQTVESLVRTALTAKYGSDVSLLVWEGTPQGESTAIAEARSTVSTFSLVVNLLGFILLVTGSIGILSIMLVEVLGRSRQIAIERALGASGRILVAEYFTRSLLLAGLAALVGVVLSLVVAQPLRQLVLPIFNGVHAVDLGAQVITPGAVGIGVVSALLVGGVFGVFPVIPALHANIAEGMGVT
jgi:putative ABC transport system permease protein